MFGFGIVDTLAMISIILLLLSLSVGLFEIFSKGEALTGIMLGIGAMIFAVISCQISKQEKVENLEQIKNAPEEYSFYLDGQDIDFEKIDLDQYDVSYDLEKKKVFLTKK